MAETNSITVALVRYFYIKIKGSEMKGVTEYVELSNHSWECNCHISWGYPPFFPGLNSVNICCKTSQFGELLIVNVILFLVFYCLTGFSTIYFSHSHVEYA